MKHVLKQFLIFIKLRQLPLAMKNAFLLFCFLLSPFLLISQFDASIDIVGSYDFKNETAYGFGFRVFEGNTRKSFRYGGNFNFRVFDQGHFKTGIRYVKQAFKVKETVFPEGSSLHDYVDEYYLEVPLVCRYNFSKRKFTFYTEVGISPHFYLKGKLVTQTISGYTSTDYDPSYLKDRRVRMGYIMGVGINYLISEKMQIFAQPTYRYYPMIGVETLSITGNVNYGIEFGVRRALTLYKN